jgi:hypothetical protein
MRHLDPGQAAICAAEARVLNERYAAEAKMRKAEGQRQGGATAGRGRAKAADSLGENFPPSYGKAERAIDAAGKVAEAGRSRDHVGTAFGVSGRLVDMGAKVLPPWPVPFPRPAPG